MKLSVDIEMGIDVIHKTGKEIKASVNISKSWDENSEEFQELVKAYTEESGMERKDSNKNKFDEEMLRYAAEQLEQSEEEARERIINAYRTYCSGKADCGYIEYAGYIFNLSDISAMHFNETKLRIRKG